MHVVFYSFCFCVHLNEGTPMLSCSHGDVQLESGRYNREGTLRVCIDGTWSNVAVCSSGWDNRDAAVVCRQLGFTTSGTLLFSNNYVVQL